MAGAAETGVKRPHFDLALLQEPVICKSDATADYVPYKSNAANSFRCQYYYVSSNKWRATRHTFRPAVLTQFIRSVRITFGYLLKYGGTCLQHPQGYDVVVQI